MLRKIPFIRSILKKRRQRKEELWFLTHSNCPECGHALGYIPDASTPFCKVCGHKINPDTIRKEEVEQICVCCGLKVSRDIGYLPSMYYLKSEALRGLCHPCAVAFGLRVLSLHLDDELLKEALGRAYDHILIERWEEHAAIKAQKQAGIGS